jgi:hypothetical protein
MVADKAQGVGRRNGTEWYDEVIHLSGAAERFVERFPGRVEGKELA